MRILIIESELTAIKRLENLLKEVVPASKVIGRCKSVKETFKWLQSNKLPDLIFSAVELRDGLSFEILRNMADGRPVIFTCKYEKYAIDAFKANGIYYLLKPIKKVELYDAIKKCETDLSATSHFKNITQYAKYQERFIVSKGQQLKLVKTEEVAYFYTEHKIIYMMLADGSRYIVNYNLEQLEGLLNPSAFFRINRQFIINISSIVKMIPTSKSRLQVILRPPSVLNTITSSGRTDRFCKWMIGDFVKEP